MGVVKEVVFCCYGDGCQLVCSHCHQYISQLLSDLVRTWSCGGVNQHWTLPADGREIVSTVAVAMMGTTSRVDDQLSAKEN